MLKKNIQNLNWNKFLHLMEGGKSLRSDTINMIESRAARRALTRSSVLIKGLKTIDNITADSDEKWGDFSVREKLMLEYLNLSNEYKRLLSEKATIDKSVKEQMYKIASCTKQKMKLEQLIQLAKGNENCDNSDAHNK